MVSFFNVSTAGAVTFVVVSVLVVSAGALEESALLLQLTITVAVKRMSARARSISPTRLSRNACILAWAERARVCQKEISKKG